MLDGRVVIVLEVWMVVRDPDKLAALVKYKGISHRMLAAAIGHASHSYVGDIVSGRVTSTSVETAHRIAAALGVPCASLFAEKAATKSSRSQVATKTGAAA